MLGLSVCEYAHSAKPKVVKCLEVTEAADKAADRLRQRVSARASADPEVIAALKAEAKALEAEANQTYAAAYDRALDVGMLSPEREKALSDLGMTISRAKGGKLKAKISTPERFAELWDDHLREIMRLDPTITEADVFRPVYVYKNPAGKYEWHRPGVAPSPGAVRVTEGIPAEEYGRMAREGASPLGDVNFLTPGMSSTQSHDRFHFDGWKRNPRLMKAQRHAVVKHQNILDGIDAELGAIRQELSGSLTGIERGRLEARLEQMQEKRRRLRIRINNAIEDMILVRQDVDLKMNFFSRGKDGFVTVENAMNSLEIYGEASMEKEYRRIKDALFSWINPAGGTASDIPSSMAVFDYKYMKQLTTKNPLSGELLPFHDRGLFDMFRRVQYIFESAPPMNPYKLAEFKKEALARVQVALHYMQKITPEEWMRYASLDYVDKSSPVYHLFCRSGIWESSLGVSRGANEVIFNAYCK